MNNLNYPIFFSDQLEKLQELIKANNYGQVVLLLDENVHDKVLPLLSAKLDLTGVEIVEIIPGEQEKNLDTCTQIWSFLSELKLKRNDLIINLGGGVITDMGGFIAASYKRGVDFVQIPTTLLAMVDASVGSKVGVDFLNFKNQIGAFADPIAVYIDPEFLNTLSVGQWLSGFAEMIKHAIIKGGSHYNKLLSVKTMEDVDLEMIKESVAIKTELVLQDPFEKGVRKHLNFGHTIGHALESFALTHEEELLHGHAVALGMVLEIKLACLHLGLNSDDFKELLSFITSKYPPFYVKEKQIDELIELMYQDKKNNNQFISFTLLKEIGLICKDEYPEIQLIKTVLKDNLIYEG